MVFLSQNLYNCNIPLTNELKLYAKDFFPEKFLYRKFDCFIVFLFVYSFWNLQNSVWLVQPLFMLSLPRDMTETGEQVESVILIFEFLENLI